MNKRIKTNRIDPLRHGPECVPAFHQGLGITVLSICDISDLMYGNWENYPNYEQRCKDLNAYLVKYPVSYYARPREAFFLFEAINLAIEEGCGFVIVENMS